MSDNVSYYRLCYRYSFCGKCVTQIQHLTANYQVPSNLHGINFTFTLRVPLLESIKCPCVRCANFPPQRTNDDGSYFAMTRMSLVHVPCSCVCRGTIVVVIKVLHLRIYTTRCLLSHHVVALPTSSFSEPVRRGNARFTTLRVCTGCEFMPVVIVVI